MPIANRRTHKTILDMELLLSEHPLLKSAIKYKSIQQLLPQLLEESDCFNIATGYVSNSSIVQLNDIVCKRRRCNNKMELNLFIGMDYIERFTRIQYDALVELNKLLETDRIGRVMVSTDILYHGKMYAFENKETCDYAFIGSSNLGSFLGTSDELIETDICVHGEDAVAINTRIKNIYRTIGTCFSDLPAVTEFKTPKFTLLDNNTHVRKFTDEEMSNIVRKINSSISISFPLKATPQSNLNAYFGAGKRKGFFSPRDWYEVELIVSEGKAYRQRIEAMGFPVKDEVFTVITNDGYEFKCQLQGGNRGKNLRSVGDLKILGKWIKGHLENNGYLQLGKPVTDTVLQNAGKSKLTFTKMESGEWYLTME